MTLGEAAFAIASPLLILWAARWGIGLVRGYGHLFDDDHFGDTVAGTIFFAVVLLVGIFGCSMFANAARMVVLESACPCCGAQRRRDYQDPSKLESPPAPCGACLAYLRVKGLAVTEEPTEAVGTSRLNYELSPERYLPVATRDDREHFKFEMPPMCAVCGSPNADQLRAIGEWGRHHTDFGVLGAVASMAADEVSTDVQLASKGRLQHNAPITAQAPSALLDAGLRDLKVPVCTADKRDLDDGGDALQYSSGKLLFASYRYYKAFCELNRIVDAKPPVTG